MEFGETVDVTYTPPANGRVQDGRGNLATAIAAGTLDVTINVIDPDEMDPPDAESVSVNADGSLVTVSYDEPIFFTGFPPNAPTNLRELSVDITEITWAWTRPTIVQGVASEATGYEYRYKSATGTFTQWTPESNTEVTITGLTADTEYTIEVRAVNVDGTSSAISDTASTQPTIPRLPEPESISRLTNDAYVTWRTSQLVSLLGAYVGVEVQIRRSGVFVAINQANDSNIAYIRNSSISGIRLAFAGSDIPDAGAFLIRVRFLGTGGAAISDWREITIPA